MVASKQGNTVVVRLLQQVSEFREIVLAMSCRYQYEVGIKYYICQVFRVRQFNPDGRQQFDVGINTRKYGIGNEKKTAGGTNERCDDIRKCGTLRGNIYIEGLRGHRSGWWRKK